MVRLPVSLQVLFGIAIFLSRTGAAETRRWTPLGPFRTTTVAGVATVPADPSTLFVVAEGDRNVYRSTDGGRNWVAGRGRLPPLCLGCGPGGVAVAADGSRLYVTVYESLYVSTDGGNVWTISGAGLAQPSDPGPMATDPVDPLAAYLATDAGLYRTLDGGASWVPSNVGMDPCSSQSGCGVTQIAVDPGPPRTVWAATVYHLFRSSDGGASWTRCWTAPSGESMGSLALGRLAGTPVVYVSTGMGEISRSTDDGQTWLSVSPPDPSGGGSQLAVASGENGVVYAATGTGLRASDDGGATWRSVDECPSSSDYGRVVTNAAGSVIWLPGRSGGLYLSRDSGTTWDAGDGGLPAIGLETSSLAVDPITSSRIYAASFDRVFRSEDGGAGWTEAGRFPAEPRIVVDPVSPATVYVTTNQWSLFASEDFGRQWRLACADLGGLNLLTADFENRSLYRLSSIGFSRSSDGGVTWSPEADLRPNGEFYDKYYTILSADPAHPNVLFAGTRGESCHEPGWLGCNYDVFERIYKSADRGEHWHETGGLPQSTSVAVSAIVPDRSSESIYAVLSPAILKSTDGGETWPIQVSRPGDGHANVSSLLVDPVSPSILYAATDQGVFESLDGGGAWLEIGKGLDGEQLWGLSVSGGDTRRIYGVSHKGIWVLDEVPPAVRRVTPLAPGSAAVVTPP